MSRAEGVGRYVWMNGEIREAESVNLEISTHALHYGSAVFEGIRFYETEEGPAVFRLRDHMKRLVSGAKMYQMNLAFDADTLCQVTLELLSKEDMRRGYIRPLVYFGAGPVSLRARGGCPTEVFIMTRALGSYLGEENMTRGIRVTVSKWRKLHFSTAPTTSKGSGQYINSLLAANEAMDRGFDEALLLNVEGTVAEGAGENIFFVKDGVLVTNDATASILPGITRDTVLKLARDAGLRTNVQNFTLGELLDADEVFLTGTAAEVTPVREIDGRTFTTGAHTLTHRLQTQYQDLVHGRLSGYQEWLSIVPPAREP